MASIQLRNVPDDLYDEIARRAKNEDRTIPQQALNILRDNVISVKEHMERRRQVFERNKDRKWPPITFDVVEEIRKDRER